MVGSDEMRRQTSEVFLISIMLVWNIGWGCDVCTVLGRSDAGASIHTLSEAPAMVSDMRCVCCHLIHLWRFQDVYRVPLRLTSLSFYGMSADPAGDGGLLYRATWRVAHDLLHDARGRASNSGTITAFLP
jgi:hypothetical protein